MKTDRSKAHRLSEPFKLEGDATARTALKNAINLNPHVVPYLLDPDTIPPAAPPHFALGSKQEAAYVAEGLQAAFDATPDALSWLQMAGGQVADRRGRVRRGKRSRRR